MKVYEPARETAHMPLEDPTHQRTHVSSEVEQSGRSRRQGRSAARLYSAALLTLGAAVIHFAVAPRHLAEHPAYAIFFVGLGLAQLTMAVAIVLQPRPRLFVVASGGTLAVIGLWLLSRTAGLPIGPNPWHPEPVGLLDLIATLAEAISVLLFLLLINRPPKVKVRGRVRVALATMPSLLLALLAAFLGVGSALNPMPIAYSAAPAIPGQASTSVADLVAPAGSQPIKSFTLTAAATNIGGHRAWAYNHTVPGPKLSVTQGDRVRVTLINHLDASTSIHWHGINVPGSMDGVAGITQNAVPAGRSLVYEFIASDPGTYWYHAHQDAETQIGRGLFGSIVILPRAGSVPEKRDYSLMIHNQPGTGAIAVNGTANLHLDAAPGDTVRLRLTNGAVPGFDLEPVTPVLVGAPYVVAALDGHDLNGPQQLGPQRVPLGMGQRADLVFTMPAAGVVRVVGMKAAQLPWSSPTSAVVTIGDGPAPAAVNVSSLPTFDLTRYGLKATDPLADAAGYDVTRQIVLGAGSGFRNGGFEFMDTFNGQASPYVAPITVRQGQLVQLQIVNPEDQSSHPIHIHGHVLTILAKNGHPLAGSPIHVDAVLVGPHETWDVAFRADNPGIWMLHCHVLVHAAAGMSMTINYDGISTPFTMGSRSGNVPE